MEKKIGKPPGSYIYVGNEHQTKPSLRIIKYDKYNYDNQFYEDIKSGIPVLNLSKVNWVKLSGIHETSAVTKLGHYFNIDDLTLEDILNTRHTPKIDATNQHIYITVKTLHFNNEQIETTQISLFIKSNFVVSFQEIQEDALKEIIERITLNKGIIRTKKSDYLVYTILDVIVDHYFEALEQIQEKIDHVEEQVFKNPKEEILHKILQIKKNLITIRRAIHPLKEELFDLSTSKHLHLIEEDTLKYFKDVYEHTVALIETTENLRELNYGLKDLYLSSINIKMNQIMQILTIFSSIFIPLTFIAGVYGMNFKHMPELDAPHGYFIVLAIMIVIVLSLLWFFKKKKWI